VNRHDGYVPTVPWVNMRYLIRELRRLKAKQHGHTYSDVFPLKTQTFQSVAAKLSEYLRPLAGKSTLEVGAGSGLCSALLGQAGSAPVALDILPESAEYTNLVAQEFGVSIRTVTGDGFATSFPDECFDLVLSFGLIEHFEYQLQLAFVREMRRVSKGSVLVGIPNPCEDSAFSCFQTYSAAYDHDEQHLPVDFGRLFVQAGLREVARDGAGVFLNRTEMGTRCRILDLYRELSIEPPANGYSKIDIPRLVDTELALAPHQRVRFGFLL
jgi:SAM-dependent methyltransferase